jgi:hypothetical protein
MFIAAALRCKGLGQLIGWLFIDFGCGWLVGLFMLR